MASLSVEDPGLMVAVSGPLETVEEIVASIDGNVVVANVNSMKQSVIGGASDAVSPPRPRATTAGWRPRACR